jgi:hypothetical protein
MCHTHSPPYHRYAQHFNLRDVLEWPWQEATQRQYVKVAAVIWYVHHLRNSVEQRRAVTQLFSECLLQPLVTLSKAVEMLAILLRM